MIRVFLTTLALVPSLLSAQASTGVKGAVVDEAAVLWKIDPSHSQLTFSIRHLVSRVRGQFGTWGGTIVANPTNWNSASVDVSADAATIDTNNERRDADLRGSDHFDATGNPKITFRSNRITRFAGDSLTARSA